MAALAEAACGIAKEIMTAVDSEQYDLAGYTCERATELMKQVFSTPLDSENPLRFSFVIGGGKLVRTSYNPDLGKKLAFTLRELGFEEDRGASVSLQCQGVFKTQNDTGKNLLYMHVYPHVKGPNSSGGEGDGGGGGGGGGEGMQDTSSPSYLCCVSELDTFQEMMQEKTQAWKERKAALKALQETNKRLADIEGKLVSMQPLEDAEQELYDSIRFSEANIISREVLAEKISWLQASMKAMVEHGQLTAEERTGQLRQITDKLAALTEGQAQGEGGGDGEGVGDSGSSLTPAQTKQKEALQARYKKIEAVRPITHPLKHTKQIVSLYVELLKLEKIEATKGRLLTVKEGMEVGKIPDIRESLDELEASSRCWFETDADFNSRLEEVQKAAAAKAKTAAGQKGGGGGSMAAWETVTAGKKKKHPRR